MDKSFTVKEIAEMLSVNEETVRRWIRDKKLPAETNSDGSFKISPAALAKLIAENKKLSTPLSAATLAGIGIASGAVGLIPGIGIMAAPIAYYAWKKAVQKADPKRKKTILEKEEAKLYKQLAELKTQIAQLNEEAQLCQEQIKEIENEIATL